MNDYDSIPMVSQPEDLKINLFKHQLASIYQMETLEREKKIEYSKGFKETRLGVNADLTGYGKTLSMIGLITRDKMEWEIDLPYVQETITTESAGLIRNREITRYDKLPCTLILVSPSIVSQWEKELNYTNLRVLIMSNRRDIDKINVENYDVVIVTISVFNNLSMAYSKYAWKRFIFDEPGHVRVSGMREIVAGFYWFVTATPESITSHHRNCRGSFIKKIIGDGWYKFEEHFQGLILKNNPSFVKASFEMPPTIYHYHKCCQPILRVVSGLVNNTIHTMIAAGNIEGAISALGGKKTKNIIELIRQEKLEKQTKLKADIDIYRNIKKDDVKLEEAEIKYNNIEEQLTQLDNRFKIMLTDKCSICMNNFIEPVLQPCCQNLFCGKCLLTWLQKADNCPLCRNKVDTTELVYLENKNEKITNIDSHCNEHIISPLQKVIEIIQNNKEGKFLIFSAYDATFQPICKILQENNISFTQVKGAQKTRQKNIDSFKHGDTKVIFLNTNFNGAGINLQEATDIILYHEMNLSTQNQIVGRANRIGRAKPLQVHQIQVNI